MSDAGTKEYYFRATDAASGAELDPPYAVTSISQVARVCEAAEAAFDEYRAATDERRALFLETIGEEILRLEHGLIERAARETGLPATRLVGERDRTVGQLRVFADAVRAGRWHGVRIDRAQPERRPLRRPDLRLRALPVGPVAVFGAANFPFAFSTAGGDTASALAAGCTVVVKGHPAHPGTDLMVGDAIRAAIRRIGMPEGTFGHVRGPGNELGTALVRNPHIAAVGFTGSRTGGLALLRLAQARALPIPVYAEMSSVNPVVLMPAALRTRGAALGEAFVHSLTVGAGQFCTNPGLVLAVRGPGLTEFIAAASKALSAYAPQPMLNRDIRSAFLQGTAALAANPAVQELAAGLDGDDVSCAKARLFSTDATTFLRDPALAAEVFGASALLVRCIDIDELRQAIRSLEGQLTFTLQLDEDDHDSARELVPLLERKAGRVLANGWPTGVEVTHAMVHGGPFPATSDGRSTSVGTLAMQRFLRPVCYQDLPATLLPEELRDDAAVPRLTDGVASGRNT